MARTASFPDIEQWLCQVVNVGVPIASKVPNPRPTEFVRAFRTGGPGRVTRVSEIATVVVESFAATESRAIEIAQACRRQLAALEGATTGGLHLKTVTEDSGPGNLPHPTIPGSRYTQTFDLHVKGTP